MRSRLSIARPAGLALCALALAAAPRAAHAQPAPAAPAAPAEGPPAPAAEAAAPPAPAAPAAPPAGEPAAKAQAKQPSGSPGKLAYDKGFSLKTEDGKYSLLLTGRVQPFFVSTRTAGPPKNVASSFEVRRARVTLEGNLHGPGLLYKLQTDFGKGFVTLKDFHFDAEIAKDVWVRAGQWKRPFSRQFIASSARLELADRAITDKAFAAGRDLGIGIGNRYEKSPAVEWVVGVFNGTGDTPKLSGIGVTVDPDTGEATATGGSFSNVPKEMLPAVVARVGVNRGGIKGYSEADLEGGPLRWSAAASVWLEGDLDDNQKSNQRAQVDFLVKYQGLSATGALYAQTDQKPDAGSGVLDAELSQLGLHVQAGYMAVPKRCQVAARYALVNDPRTKETVAKDQQEVSLAASYFLAGHDAKLVAGAKLQKLGAADLTDSFVLETGANVGW